MIKVIIFDMDGTLADTDDVLIATWNEIFKIFKDKDFKYDNDLIRTFSGPPLVETLNKYFSEYDPNYIKKEYNLRTKKYYDLYVKSFDNELEIIKKLYDEGYKLAVFTNKNRERTLYCLEKLKLDKYFSYIISSDDVKNTKPHKEGIDKIIVHFNINKDEAILIGDTVYDYLAANNANIDSILLQIVKRNYPSDIKPLSICKSYDELYDVIKKINKNG